MLNIHARAIEPTSPPAGADAAAHTCRIGPFLLDLRGEILFHDATPLPLGRRAIALLILLVRHAGQPVSKEAMMHAGWHGLIVEEGNLATQISALRRTLKAAPGGDGWIETLPRRGYRFTGPVHWPEASPHPLSFNEDDPPSLAVLPFSVRDPTLAEFAAGLAEDVVSMLASLRELVVISRASTLAVQAQLHDAASRGRALGVRYLISGSVRRQGAGLRVVVELADCATGIAIWSRGFDTAAEAAPQAPVPIVALIVNTLAPRVREQELRRIQGRAPQDLGVHLALLRARTLLARHSDTGMEQARALINHALARDPHCAAAHTLAMEWHSLMVSSGRTTDRAAELRLMEHSALHAIALDGANATALARIGHGRALHHRDFPGAQAFLERALDAGPNLPKVWELSSLVLSWLGDGEGAIRHAARALQLSPCDPLAYQMQAAMALAHFVAGDHAACIDWVRRSHTAHPRKGAFQAYAAASAAALGRMDAAHAFMADVLAAQPDITVTSIVARHPFAAEQRRIDYGRLLLLARCPQ